MRFVDYIHLLRIKHWVKNGFVLAPAFFAKNFMENMSLALLGAFAFALMASTVYIMNDMRDVEYDKQSDSKINVFVTGQLSMRVAWQIAVVLFTLSIGIGIYLGAWHWLLIYLGVNVIYSFGGKQIPYLEMLFVVSGFLIRIQFGGEIVDVPITHWLYAEVFFFTSMIIIAKRMGELSEYKNFMRISRKVITKYNRTILITFFVLFILAFFAGYVLYCLDEEVIERMGEGIFSTFPVVVAGMIRFVSQVIRQKSAVNPVDLFFKDPFLMIVTLIWIITWVGLLYV